MAIAYRAGSTAGNASGGNLSVNKPTGTTDGDILVAVLYREAGTWTLPSGWTQWGSDQRDYSNNLYLTVAWKRASSEGASWTFNLSTTTWRVISIGAFSGCIASGDPIDAGPTGAATNLTAPSAASITTTTANAMLVATHGNYDGTDVSAGTSGYARGANLGGCEIWYLLQASAGASGSKTFARSSGTAGYWASLHLALKEASAGGQTLSPGGISSAEAFGADTITPGAVSILPGGIAGAETFGTTALVPGAVTVSPGGIVSGEAVGSASVGSSVAPTGIASSETIGAAQLAAGTVTVAPASLASEEAFGNTVVSGATVFVLPGAIGSTEAFGTETITPGAVQLTPGSIATAEAFGAALLGLTVSPAGIAGGEALGAATLAPGTVTIAPGGIAGGEAFGTTTVSGPTFNYNISVGAGYTDVSPKQLVRTKSNRLYVCASECDSYPCEATAQKLRMYGANQTGLQSSFSRKDSTHEPGGVAGWAIAIDGNDLIHVVWTERTSNGGTIANLKYTTFDPAADTWGGTIETVVGSMNTDGVGQGVQTVALALDSSGVPHIVYVQGNGTARRVYYRNRSGGSWSSATQLDTGVTYTGNQRAWHPNLSFDGAGRILALWLRGTFNDTADGTIYSRVYSGGSWGSTVQVSSTGGALTSIDQSTSILITPDGTYHTTYINASLTPGDKYIRYRYSTDQGATWSANDPGSGTQATHNPALGWTGSKIRIMAHGTPDAGNHGINLYYFEGDGGAGAWGSWTQFVTGNNYDSSVATRWAQYFNYYPHTLDVAYWDDNYPNNLYVGTQIFGLDVALSGLATGEAFGAAVVGSVIAPAGIGSGEAFGAGTIAGGGISLILAGIGSAESFGGLVVSVGAISLILAGISSGEAVGSPALSPGAVLLLPAGIGSGEAVSDFALSPGGVTLAPGSVSSGEAFGGAILTQGGVILIPLSVESGEIFGGPVVTPGAVMVQPGSIMSGETFGTTLVVPVTFIAVEGVASQEAISTPALVLIIQPSSLATGEAVGVIVVRNTRILFGYGTVVKGAQGGGVVRSGAQGGSVVYSQMEASSVESG